MNRVRPIQNSSRTMTMAWTRPPSQFLSQSMVSTFARAVGMEPLLELINDNESLSLAFGHSTPFAQFGQGVGQSLTLVQSWALVLHFVVDMEPLLELINDQESFSLALGRPFAQFGQGMVTLILVQFRGVLPNPFFE